MTLKIRLLVFLVAGATICIFATEATTAPAEEEEEEKELATAPLGASEGPDYSEGPTLAAGAMKLFQGGERATNDPLGNDIDPLEYCPICHCAIGKPDTDAELMTTDSITSSSDLGENTTDAEPPTTSEDHLETVTLVGIILGTIAAIGVATGIVIALAKKMSGRYSP